MRVKLLDKKEVKKFAQENGIQANSVLLELDKEKKKASFYIDGQKKLNVSYEELKKWL